MEGDPREWGRGREGGMSREGRGSFSPGAEPPVGERRRGLLVSANPGPPSNTLPSEPTKGLVLPGPAPELTSSFFPGTSHSQPCARHYTGFSESVAVPSVPPQEVGLLTPGTETTMSVPHSLQYLSTPGANSTSDNHQRCQWRRGWDRSGRARRKRRQPVLPPQAAAITALTRPCSLPARLTFASLLPGWGLSKLHDASQLQA